VAELPRPAVLSTRAQLEPLSTAMNFIARCLLAFVVASAAGCATVPSTAPAYTPAPNAPEGYATVYVYRLGAPPYTQEIKVSLAGKAVLAAPEQGYTWVHVRAGTHTLLAEWPKNLGGGGWPNATATQVFEPGKPYYLRLEGRVGSAPGGFFSGGGMLLTSMVVSRTPAEGEAELKACCRYLPASTLRIE
jgi:hypothetical protein